jgi:hypothetical protein
MVPIEPKVGLLMDSPLSSQAQSMPSFWSEPTVHSARLNLADSSPAMSLGYWWSL